jgi:hypothetical protein
MDELEPPDDHDVEIRIPPEWEAGVYANTSQLRVWSDRAVALAASQIAAARRARRTLDRRA